MKKFLRLLIVEDSEDDALTLIRELKQGGFEPHHERVETAAAMRSALQEKSWDVIVSGDRVVDLNGLEALELLKETGLDIPFIIYSRTIGKKMDSEALKAGAKYCIKSRRQRIAPIVERELRDAVLRREHRHAEEGLRRDRDIAERLAGEMTVIAEIGRLIGYTLDIEEVYERFAAETTKLISFDRLVVKLIKPHEGESRYVYVSGVDIPGKRPGDSKALSGTTDDMLLRTRSGIIVQSASLVGMAARFPGVVTAEHAAAGLRSVMSVPLIYRNEVIGALHFWSKKAEAYTEKDLSLSERIGEQIVGAIANAQLFADLKREEVKNEGRSRQLAALHESSIDLTAELNLNILLQSVAQRALDLIGGTSCNCFLYRPEADHLERFAVAGQKIFSNRTGRITRRRGEGFVGHIWEKGTPLIVDDYRSWPGRRRQYDHYPSRAMVGVAVYRGEEFLGILSISAPPPHRYTQADVEVLEMFATQAAIAIRNARLYGTIEQLAITDELTGLFNRRGFFQLGEREFEGSLRFKRSLAVLMFDIDHFKRVNDTRGHSAGDQVLRALADCSRQNTRGIDVAGRYGGEEFIFLLPETLLPGAIQIAERLRQSIAGLSIPICAENGGSMMVDVRVTVSIGVAVMLPGIQNLTVLVERADQALYHAKESGRNRVVVWGETPDS